MVGVLSYLSVLVLIAYSMADKDPRLTFHVKQGALLCIAEIAALIIFQTALFMLMPLLAVLNILFFVLSVIGIMNVLKGKNKTLPLIGHLANHLPF